MIEHRIALMRSTIEIAPNIPTETKAEPSIQGLEDSHPVLLGTVNHFATALSDMGLSMCIGSEISTVSADL